MCDEGKTGTKNKTKNKNQEGERPLIIPELSDKAGSMTSGLLKQSQIWSLTFAGRSLCYAVRKLEVKYVSKKNKKCTISRFLHIGPKWPLEYDGKVIFFDFLDNKIRNHFFCFATTICKWDRTIFLKFCFLWFWW